MTKLPSWHELGTSRIEGDRFTGDRSQPEKKKYKREERVRNDKK